MMHAEESNSLLKELPKYFDDVYNFGLRMTGNRGRAEELCLSVVQEALRFKEYFAGSNIREWALRNSVNLYNKFYKVKSLAEQEITAGDFNYSYLDKIHLNETAHSLTEKDYLKFFTSLPSDIRLVLVLKEINSLEYDSIAEILDIPVETLKIRLNYARKAIFSELNHLSEG